MSQSVTSSPVTHPTAVDTPAQDCLRQAVLSGPGVTSGLDYTSRWHLMDDGGAEVAAALDACGHVDVRRRVLPADVTVQMLLGLALFSDQGYDSVLSAVYPRISGGRPGVLPTGSALSQARARLDVAVMAELFARVAARPRPEPIGARAFGLLLTAFDGTSLDLANTDEIAACYATPTGGRYPKARLVTLVECGTRRVRAAAFDSYTTSEQELTDTLIDQLQPGTLNLADRNFFSMSRFLACAGTGAQLIWRVKNSNTCLPAKVMKTLLDGSGLVILHESDGMLHTRRRKAGDPTLTRLPDTLARLVEFTVTTTDGRARSRTSQFRILTTLLDPVAYPAQAIAAVYAQRWQIELAYYRIKVSLRGAGTVLRGRTPNLAEQEIWALLCVYDTLCDLATTTAVNLGVDPDQISFIAVLRLTRTCATCTFAAGTNPADIPRALQAAIAAHPLNRTGRQRTGPRTKRQRETEKTRNVTYTINIQLSNLPKAEVDLLT